MFAGDVGACVQESSTCFLLSFQQKNSKFSTEKIVGSRNEDVNSTTIALDLVLCDVVDIVVGI